MAANKTVHRQRGSLNGNSKLTEEQVLELRRRRIEENWSCAELARIFGIDQKTAWCIAAGKTWSHIEVANRLWSRKKRKFFNY